MFINLHNNFSKVCSLALMLVTPSVSHSIVFNFSGTASGVGVPTFLAGTPVIASINLSDAAALPGAYFNSQLGNVLSANLSVGGYNFSPQSPLEGTVSTDGSTFSSLSAFFEQAITVGHDHYDVQFSFSAPLNYSDYNDITNTTTFFSGGSLSAAAWTTPPVTFNFSGTANDVPPFPNATPATGSIMLTGASALPGANFNSSLGNVLHANFNVGGYSLPVNYPLSGTISNDGSTFSYLTALFEQESGVTIDSVDYGVQVGFSPNLGSTGRRVNSYNWNTNESATGVLNGTWSVPEPATLALMSIGLAGIGFGKRRPLA